MAVIDESTDGRFGTRSHRSRRRQPGVRVPVPATPAWAIAAAQRRPGVSGEGYPRESILDPNAFLAPECPSGPRPAGVMLQTFVAALAPAELDAVVADLLALETESAKDPAAAPPISLLDAALPDRAFGDRRIDGADLPSVVRDPLSEAHFINADGRLVAECLRQTPDCEQRVGEIFGTEPRFGGILDAVARYAATLRSGVLHRSRPQGPDSHRARPASRRGDRDGGRALRRRDRRAGAAAGGLGVAAAVVLITIGCARAPRSDDVTPPLHYVGSSTIAAFLEDVEAAHEGVRLRIESEPESAGGERAIVEGRADLGGVAGCPHRETLERGIVATPIGQDAIAVIVHASNPVSSLSRAQLAAVFSGKIEGWRELGGPDIPIQPLLVGPSSATRDVFRAAILGSSDFAGYRTVRPDAAMLEAVAADPGAIGEISFALLRAHAAVRALAVDGEPPTPENAAYPLTRPLHLLWWPARERVAELVAWLTGPEAEAIRMRHFAKPRAGACDSVTAGGPR